MRARSRLLAPLFAAGCAEAPPPEPVDDVQAAHEAPPHESLDALAHAYREVLAARGSTCTWQHESAALRCTDGSRHDLRGLWAVIQADPDPPGRARALLEPTTWSKAPDTWAQAAPFVRLRLSDQPVGAAAALHPAHPQGLQWGLDLALPGGTVPLDEALLAAWAIDRERAAQAGGAGIAAIDPRPFWPLSPHAARARVGDGHDAARLAMVDEAVLGFEARLAVVVPDEALVVGDEQGLPELQAFLEQWGREHPDRPAVLLQRSPEGWAPLDLSPG